MKKVRYSFLVANYNKGKKIEKCLNQLLKQSILDFEIIIVDDCSTDNSLEIINSIKEKYNNIELYINDENRGIGYTRNRLIELSNGEYIIFVDSDDYVTSYMLSYIEKNNNKNYDMIRFQSIVEAATPTQKLIEAKENRYRFCCIERGIVNPNDVVIEWCTNPYCANALLWSYCIKKSLFEKNNIFFPNLAFHEDFAVVPLLLSYSKEILIIDDILYHYLQYDDSVTKLKNMNMDFEEKRDFYSNKYKQYKIATMNIIDRLNDSLLNEEIRNKMKSKLLMRLEKRYTKYTNILLEEIGCKNEESCLFKQ